MEANTGTIFFIRLNQMKINHIQISNFYSFQNAEISFDDYKGLILVNGVNRDTGGSNGSGKSSIVEAIVWGLFGRTIRKSTEEAVVNYNVKKGCRITIKINDNIVISRTKRPTFLELTVNGENLTKDSVTATQFEIEKLLNTNYKIFLASLVFGQHNEVSFINADKEEKRNIIKHFLNIEDIFQVRDKIKVKKLEATNEIKTINKVYADVQDSIVKIEKKVAQASKEKEALYQKYNITSGVTVTLSSILELENKNTELVRESLELRREIKDHELKLNWLKSEIDEGVRSKIYECDSCGSSSIEEVTQETIDKYKKEYQEKLDALDYYSTRLATKGIEVINNNRNIPIPSKDYYKLEELNKIETERATLVGVLETNKTKLKELEEKEKNFNTSLEIFKFWEVAFSEQGIIKYIIDNVLDYFNEKCNYYLSYLTNSNIKILFDNTLDEKIMVNGQHTHYVSLSGGEKNKVNLAVLLGLQALLTLTSADQADIMFFDEAAENLDQDGVSALYILLQELKKNKTLFIITHNIHLKTLLEEYQTIEVVKKKGISVIK